MAVFRHAKAQRRAREVTALAKAPAKTAFTVAAAMDAYSKRLEHEGSRSLADAKRRARFHILPGLGDIPVADLTRDIISKWLTGMAGKGADGHSSQDAGQCKPCVDHPPRRAEPSLSRRQRRLGHSLAHRPAVSRGRRAAASLFLRKMKSPGW